MFNPFGGLLENNFSSFEFSDDQGNYIFAESRVDGYLPERTINKKNIKNVTVNNFFGNGSRKIKKNAHGGNNGGFNGKFNGHEFDTVDVHANNLEKVINDYVVSRAKEGYALRSKKNVRDGVMVTTKNKRGLEHARLFKVHY